MNLDGIETDIYITKDSEIILGHHRSTKFEIPFWDTNRNEEVMLNVLDHTLEELHKYCLMDKKTKIPTLKEFLI